MPGPSDMPGPSEATPLRRPTEFWTHCVIELATGRPELVRRLTHAAEYTGVPLEHVAAILDRLDSLGQLDDLGPLTPM